MSTKGFGFGFDAGEWWGGWRGGRSGRRRGRRGRRIWFESGDMKYVILKLLDEKPRHGYEVMKALEEQTRGCYKPSPGTVYPTLQWLEDEGLVRVQEVNGKKVYEVTDEGRAFLEEHRGTVEDIFDRVHEMMDTFLSDPLPEVTRLVGRVVPLSYRAAWKTKDDSEKRGRVGEILEAAIRDLESLTK